MNTHEMEVKLLRHWPAIVIVIATTVLLFWLTFAFTLNGEISSEAILDAQARSFLEGKWDVSPSRETFQHNNKYYYYFGPLPSFLRIPFLIAPPLKYLDRSFLIFFASLLNLTAALLILYSLNRLLNRDISVWSSAVFSLIAGFGSTLSIIASRPSVYHETIAWGAGFILMAAWSFLQYLRSPSAQRVMMIGCFGLAATFSRQIWLTSALGLLAAIYLVVWRQKRKPVGDLFLAGAGSAIILSTVFAIGYIKFGQFTLAPPLDQHAAFQDPNRLAQAGGSMFHLSNLRGGLVNYLALDNIAFTHSFPYIRSSNSIHIYPSAKYDGFEEFVSLPWAMGACLALTILGGIFAARSSRWTLLTVLGILFVGAAPLLLFVGLCGRYLHDFYPPLIFGGALGISTLHRTAAARVIVPVLIPLILVNVCVDSVIAFRYHLDFAPPDRKATLVSFSGSSIHQDNNDYRWGPEQTISVKYRLKSITPAANYPLLVIGRPGTAIFVWLRIDSTGGGQYCFNSWGESSVPCSFVFPVNLGEQHWLHATVTKSGQGIQLRHDGNRALDATTRFYVPGADGWIGLNPVGGGLTLETTPAEFEVTVHPPD